MRTVGVLAFQGDFEKHAHMLQQVGAHIRYVRSVDELEGIDAAVIPGGESTTIGKLMHAYGILGPLNEKISNGLPIFGTCAGLILLSPEITEKNQHRLGVLDVTVERNAYGRQLDSFEADIEVPVLGPDPVRGVFIRAPRVSEVGPGIEILAEFENCPVLLRKDHILASSFHPELTADARVHKYFLEIVCGGAH